MGKPETDKAGTQKADKAVSRRRASSSKTTARSLTDAEYEEIFKAVIETQEADLDIYLAPTQHDSQTGKESPAGKATASAGTGKNLSIREELSDSGSSDKEHQPRNEKAADDATINDCLAGDSSRTSEKAVNSVKDNEGMAENADKTSEGKVKPSEAKKKVLQNKDKTKKKSDKRDDHIPKQHEVTKKMVPDPASVKPKKTNDKHSNKMHKKSKITKTAHETDNALIKENKGQVDDLSTPVSAPKKGNESDTVSKKQNKKKGDIKPFKVQKPKKVCTEAAGRETDRTEPTEKQKAEPHQEEAKHRLSKKKDKEKTESAKGGTESEGFKKQQQRDHKSLAKGEDTAESKKADSSTETVKGKKDELKCAKGRKDKADDTKDEIAEGGGRAGAAGEEGMESEAKVKMEEETDDVVSVLSEQSLGSSLLDLAQAVDQWDRLEEIQELNELTPCITEPKASAEIDSPAKSHKPKKRKRRENQLAPRKLSFDGTGLNKKRKRVQESDSDGASSVPADLGTWVQCEAGGCQKWRYLPDIHDPVELPQYWVCSMNKDERYNSCDLPEQEYDESDHILTQYTLGSIVWVKMDGFPWWPAMVDTDPDSDVYCQIPHEDSMVPTDYHVVFLDEKVTRSWITKSRVQHLTLEQLAPGSAFLKGHRYKKEIQVATKRAEAALQMSLQDRMKQFGFSACFRNQTTRWTKGETKPKKTQKREAPKPKGPVWAKRSRQRTDRHPSQQGRDSHSCADNTGYSPDSHLSSRPSSSDEGSDRDSCDEGSDKDSSDSETTMQRLLDSRKGKAKRSIHDRKKLKKNVSASERNVEDKKAEKKDLGRVGDSKKLLKNVPPSERNTEHKKAEKKDLNALKLKRKSEASVGSAGRSKTVSCNSSGHTKSHRQERKEDSTDSDDSAQEELVKATKHQKKKFKPSKTLESKSSPKKLGHPKVPLSVFHSEDKNVKDTLKAGKGDADNVHPGKDKASSAKGSADNQAQNHDSANKTETLKEPAKCSGDEHHGPKPPSHQPAQRKKLFKSEKARKRDEALRLQQREQRESCAGAEDKKTKTKPQKFVAPVKTSGKSSLPDKPASKLVPSAQTGAALSSSKSDEKRLKDQRILKKPADTGTEEETTPVHGKHQNLEEKAEQCPSFDSQPPTQHPTPEQYAQEPPTPNKCSPLGPHYKDQFVPSADMSDSDEGRLSAMEDAAAGDSWKSRDVSGTRGGTQEGKRVREEDSDSDCLDLEEDLPIPSLQQVLQVPCKGSSDLEGGMSDPLEMAED